MEKIIKNNKIIAVICNQWGDTGKGKFTDYFASDWADVIARGTGGNNAGHTVVVGGKQTIFHLIPTGIVYDNKGKINILGNGMVIDIQVLCDEMDELKKENCTFNNLMISEDAHVIMPYHIERDKKKFESLQKGGIGSTGRGIGPAYTDKVARRGIFIRDLLNIDILTKKINIAKEFYPEVNISTDQILDQLKPYIERIKPFIKDTIDEIKKFKEQGKNILLEGAQGILLSIDYGTYPYVTTSDCSINGTALGVGLSPKDVDLTLGIVKFPYMTRVGGGPFPTEFGRTKSEDYCAEGLTHDVVYELNKYNIPFKEVNNKVKYDHEHPEIIKLINSSDEFEQGIGIRLAGAEYGATTRRPRRTGWTDLVSLKYAVGINGADIILTKVDVLKGAKEIKLAIGYDNIKRYKPDTNILKKTKPIYKTFKGFDEDISKIKDYNDLPETLKEVISFAEEFTGAKVRIVSTGPDRNETIIKST